MALAVAWNTKLSIYSDIGVNVVIIIIIQNLLLPSIVYPDKSMESNL